MSGLVAEHVVTRSVRDSAAVLDCTAGPAVGDPYWAPPPQRSFLEEVSRDPGRLRIAFWTRTLQGESVHRECVAAVERTAQVCSKLGHEVEEACPQLIDPEPLARAFLTIWAAGCTVAIDVAGLASGRQPRAEHFEPLTWALYEQGKEVSAARYQMSVGLLQLAARQLGTFLERYAVWLTPTLGQPPVKLGTIDTSESDAEKAFAPIFGYLPFTWLFNGSGQPALSLPLHWSVDGLPIGVHFAGRFGDEGLLYRLAGQLEQAVPWRDRKPPIWD
jgi:amidase